MRVSLDLTSAVSNPSSISRITSLERSVPMTSVALAELFEPDAQGSAPYASCGAGERWQ